MFVLGHEGSDFQSSFYAFSFYQAVLRKYTKKLLQTNAKTNCQNPWAGPYFTVEMGNLLSQKEMDGIDWIKTP